jgi:pimeloyl-ACP methyl ester carboxylesterase
VAVRSSSPVTMAVGSPERVGFGFSPNGDHAVCLLFSDEGPAVERWTFEGASVRRSSYRLPIAQFAPDDEMAQVCIDDAGGIFVLVRQEEGFYEIYTASPGHAGPIEAPWAFIDAPRCELGEGRVALAISHSSGVSTLWVLDPVAGLPRAVTTVDGILRGGLPLHSSDQYVAFNLLHPDRPCVPVVIDTTNGLLKNLIPGLDGLQIVLADPDAGHLLCAVNVPASPLFAMATLDQATMTACHPRISPGLASLEGSVRALAFDTADSAAYFTTQRGVRSHLIRHDLVTDTHEEVKIGLGIIDGPGNCGRGVLRFPFATPHERRSIVTVSSGPGGPRLIMGAPHVGAAARRASSRNEVRAVWFETPEGSIEALVYGESWASAERVLIALHGGPEARWQAEYNPLLVDLAHAGVTVVAINLRGSTGYGESHQNAIRHAWGGPDLADIRYIADQISVDRAKMWGGGNTLMIYGQSYGAYLALLAACTQPQRWSHCIAVSPFLNGERLYRETRRRAVQRMIDRLGGRTTINDDIGPRDLLRLAKDLAARTLLIHGTVDGIIPVSHSQELYAYLVDLGTCPDVSYVETYAGHTIIGGAHGRPIAKRIIEHLADPQWQ